LIGFIFLVRKHSLLFDQKVHLENLVKINHLEGLAIHGNHEGFPNGAGFIDPHHPYTHDLDIFGEGSLFQAISRCNTIHGKQYMAQRLSYPLGTAGEIALQQEAAQELSHKTDFRQHFQASGMEIGEQPYDREQLLDWLDQPSFLYKISSYKTLLVVLPILTIAAVASAFFMPIAKPVAILLVMLQWGIRGKHGKKITVFHEYISQKKNILEKYARLLHYVGKENFSATILKKLSSNAHEADGKVKSLASLVSYLNARFNFLLNAVVNSLLLYDLQCVYRLEKWKHENAATLKIWLDVISEMEVLCSLGTFSFNYPTFIYPRISSEISIKANGLGHPLLSEKECVTNDLYIGKGQTVLIITGANMAGKSTFLRTSGVNLVLALAGAPVYAKEFSCPIINLRSGMRTADSLKDHQSYFYAELNRLKTIMDELRSDKPLFILLDEILKGTNSTDKQSGSIALVQQLLPHPCLAMIATHDIVLGELENQFPNQIKNYFFEANIENDQLSFDYKLKPGIAQKMNATFLMKKMGIIGSV
jgi:DNA mismatch repair ATPase MutS